LFLFSFFVEVGSLTAISSVRNWIAVNAVEQFNLNKK